MENFKTTHRIFKKDILVESVRIPPSKLDDYSAFILNSLKEREKNVIKMDIFIKS